MGKKKDKVSKTEKRRLAEAVESMKRLLPAEDKPKKKKKKPTEAEPAPSRAPARRRPGGEKPPANKPQRVAKPKAAEATFVPTKVTGPRLLLEVGKIMPDGQVEVKFDWNEEFLNQIRGRGFTGVKDEESVMSFLSWMFIVRMSDTPDAAVDNHLSPEVTAALKAVSEDGRVVS